MIGEVNLRLAVAGPRLYNLTMTLRSKSLVALLAGAGLGFAGCENLSPEETTGPFQTGGAVAAGNMARAAGASTSGGLVASAGVNAVAVATINVIAKHQATARQREVAVARAKAAQAKLAAQQHRAEEAAKKAGKKYVAAKQPRFIAVDTVKNEQTSAHAQKAVMIWDTQSEQIVGNNVYDVENPPQIGQTAKFETYSAEYVGGS
jgi:hypothetical protein